MTHLSIGTAWAEAAAGLRRERALLAPVVLGLILLPSVVSAMIQPSGSQATSAQPGWWMLAAVLILLVTMVGQMTVVLIVDGWHGSVGQAIGRAARRLPTLILAGLALMIPLFVVMLVLLMAIGGAPTAPQEMSGGAALGVLLYMMLILFIAVRLLPMIAFAATGDDSAIALLRRTWRATSGHFWKLFGFFLLWVIAFVVVALAVGAVFGSIITVALGRPEPWSVSLLMLAAITGVVQALFLTTYSAMLARIVAQLDDRSTSGT